MTYSEESLKSLNKVYRLNLINSITGYKPANLIGTKSKNGVTNLAIFSSVVHLGSKPALIGIVTRPNTIPRHTYKNIIDTKYFTINHISKENIKKAHYTSAKFKDEESEFEKCSLEEMYIDNFYAPFVKESKVKIGLKLVEEITINSNNTILIVGRVTKIKTRNELIEEDGSLKFEELDTVCISGLDSYYSTKKIAKYPYAKRNELPKKW